MDRSTLAREIYMTALQIVERKKALRGDLDALREEFASFAESKPTIYGGIVHGTLDWTKFKVFAETAECVQKQVQNPNQKGPPPHVPLPDVPLSERK